MSPGGGPADDRFFKIFSTGHSVPAKDRVELKFINTFLMQGGSLVFHAFEVVR